MKVFFGNFLRLVNKYQQQKHVSFIQLYSKEGFHPIANVTVLFKVLLLAHKPGHFHKGQCKISKFELWFFLYIG